MKHHAIILTILLVTLLGCQSSLGSVAPSGFASESAATVSESAQGLANRDTAYRVEKADRTKSKCSVDVRLARKLYTSGEPMVRAA